MVDRFLPSNLERVQHTRYGVHSAIRDGMTRLIALQPIRDSLFAVATQSGQ